MKPWMYLPLIALGGALGLGIVHLLTAPAQAATDMPVLCRVPDPHHIDGLCWDGKTTRTLAKGYGVVELEDGVYLVGYDE